MGKQRSTQAGPKETDLVNGIAMDKKTAQNRDVNRFVLSAMFIFICLKLLMKSEKIIVVISWAHIKTLQRYNRKYQTAIHVYTIL